MPVYTVRNGDTLSGIARKYGLPSWRVLYHHPSNKSFRQKRPNPNLIFPGDRINIPGAAQYPLVQRGNHACLLPVGSPTRPSVVDLAELAKAVYSDATSVTVHPQTMCTPYDNVWHRTKTERRGSFLAALYELKRYDSRCAPERDDIAVLAFAGSNDPGDWIVDNRQILMRKIPQQAPVAIAFAKSCMKSHRNLYLTGHSLGGALAIYVAAHTGLPAVTFSAPKVQVGCLLSAPIAGRDFFDTSAVAAVTRGSETSMWHAILWPLLAFYKLARRRRFRPRFAGNGRFFVAIA